ncbi:RagB/SusD family nutrient uptake outer membrane protein [Phocaeicola sp.]|uniref:RagB/SusD family nutrient uptake outer membrane protein n=1 Tax=Phocaeicola sp. TaxID=2773926 RepID=UPI0023C8D1DC|nr:RagB/SusD family nutrient uptake outer membrane protein [Phocaeicola sp.]MDE5678697.1 RagB/SusD family nutrient uptake outer membrane protein [Phocaeicola sp.]
MKLKKSIYILMTSALMMSLSSCNDMLDMEPKSAISPENYMKEESQLDAYALNCYGYLPWDGTVGPCGSDNATDIQAGMSVPDKYLNNRLKVGQTGGAWGFGEIYNVNYFFSVVEPAYEAGAISGNDENIRHYIGEMHFFRALLYFNKLRALGDFPIVTTTLRDNKEELIEASKRMPRTEVARFILEELDKAAEMMRPVSPDGNRNRMNSSIARILKSRVALFEGTWLKYFKNTPFVPNGPGWPGAGKDYNAGYQFKAGSIDDESNWFLDQAVEAAAAVADAYQLTPNSGILPQSAAESNEYVEMFGAVDLKPFSEVMLWKACDKGLGVTHNIQVNASTSNVGIGVTRAMVNTYLLKDGRPYYAEYGVDAGDESIEEIRASREDRAMLFLKQPGQINMWINLNMGSHGSPVEPKVMNITAGSEQFRYNTGYTSRKGVNPDKALCDNWGSYGGVIIFRASEAYLNYIEAYYERHGQLDAKANGYWNALRQRAGIGGSIQSTIDATDMAIEAKFNWAAYSGGQLIDKTLYNIRRERVSELMGEGFRWDDLRRWRSMDQLMDAPYFVEGIKVWGDYYKALYEQAGMENKDYQLVYEGSDANVSSPALSPYLRVYQYNKEGLGYNGYTWHMGHYLDPIAIQHFKITATDQEGYSDSPLYQNPYWGLRPDTPAEK